MTFYSDGDRGTPSISVQAANLWYDIRDTYIVRFVADGCRKNLPLSARQMIVHRISGQKRKTLLEFYGKRYDTQPPSAHVALDGMCDMLRHLESCLLYTSDAADE